MRNLLSRFLADKSGATAIEYGLIAAGIAVVIIGTVNTLGGSLDSKFLAVNNNLGG
ncbi:MAG: Flp family type IVb pilin [Alphaproteobacteria bacterium]|nr:Flp family type IVb pilin [Alphaproteobacteria bacterium]